MTDIGIAITVSALIGGLTVWLSLRKRLEEESLGKATRRTSALQLLSDEEFTLEQVRDECAAIDTLIDVGEYQHREHLRNEARRIQAESAAMLAEVRDRRRSVESRHDVARTRRCHRAGLPWETSSRGATAPHAAVANRSHEGILRCAVRPLSRNTMQVIDF